MGSSSVLLLFRSSHTCSTTQLRSRPNGSSTMPSGRSADRKLWKDDLSRARRSCVRQRAMSEATRDLNCSFSSHVLHFHLRAER